MGRGKVQMKKIEDKNSRQVTFSKRRTGLMKKARELSILCDVEVALFILSAKGRFYEFSSGTNLRKILERYLLRLGSGSSTYSHANEAEISHSEDTGLWKPTDPMKMSLSELQENVDHLSALELTQLEEHLDSILRRTRSKKAQLMMEAMTALENEVGPVMNEDGNRPIMPQRQEDGESSAAAAAAAGSTRTSLPPGFL